MPSHGPQLVSHVRWKPFALCRRTVIGESEDPVAQNEFLLPEGNIVDGYGIFFSKASKAFLVNIVPDSAVEE